METEEPHDLTKNGGDEEQSKETKARLLWSLYTRRHPFVEQRGAK